MAKDFRNFTGLGAHPAGAAGPGATGNQRAPVGFARTSLEALGVEVHVDSRVEGIDAGAWWERRAHRGWHVLWAAGVVASPAARGCEWNPIGRDASRSGRIFRPRLPDVFAIGDTALSLAWDGPACSRTAPAAKQGVRLRRSCCERGLRNRNPPPRSAIATRQFGHHRTKSASPIFGRFKLTGAVACGCGAP